MYRVVKIVWSCGISLVANNDILYMGWHRTVGSLGSKHKDAIHEWDSGILKIKVGGNLAVPTIISQ